ncbi:hypothetical protein [Paenibacillus odorifer]|uniref:hypothetical protein n=1 Tax=Paenibacillus odorifer TaxID=189426 RepID=UPI00096E3F8D|nr:hypothetical protein [Paenibacillus odorifer]OMD92792.1 hypothetical protein BSK67_18695 [Paenibacillus odorifer]
MAIDINKEIAHFHEVNILLNSNVLDVIQTASESKELSQEALNQLDNLLKVREDHLNAVSKSLKQQIEQSGKDTMSDILRVAKNTSEEIATTQASIKAVGDTLNKDHQTILKGLYEGHENLIHLIETGHKKSQETLSQLSNRLKCIQDEQSRNHAREMNSFEELNQAILELKETTSELLIVQSRKIVRNQWIGFILVLLALVYGYIR